MKVKLFDFEHEEDLEKAVNKYLKTIDNVIQIQYQTSHFSHDGEQIYSFSCMIIIQE
ncbi:MAG: sporulation protein Cse60 [Anaeroplasma sp.]|nr:sporulation protein Cse60 [Anaeroplasma sp.]